MLIQKVHEDKDILNALNNHINNLPLLKNLKIPAFMFSVFISAPYMIPNLSAFKTFFENHKINVIMPSEIDSKKERLEEEDLIKYIGTYNIALIGDDRYTANIIKLGATSSNKRLIGLMKWGTGIDSIDHEAARQYNVIIKNTVDAFTEPVAESILGSILCFNRGLLSSTRMMQDSNHWSKVPCKTLYETTFGIVGFGNVGKAIATKLLKLGSKKILTYDILGKLAFPNFDLGRDHDLEFSCSSKNYPFDRYADHDLDNRLQQLDSLNDILNENPDFLIITCSANKDNIKMIGKTEL
ncbi:MAG: NAD(P)-dependent oxidoreductase, partial [Candidatus Paceibacterota bacterium]